jgi:hypothetical protein
MLLGVLAAVETAACPIVVTPRLKDDFKKASRVFVGRAESAPPIVARFTVLEPFKNAQAGEVVEASISSDCDWSSFERGTTYLIVVDGSGHVSRNSRTQLVPSEGTTDLTTVRRRAAWWRCPLSSATMRLGDALGSLFEAITR